MPPVAADHDERLECRLRWQERLAAIMADEVENIPFDR
jgi:hypothetical protein